SRRPSGRSRAARPFRRARDRLHMGNGRSSVLCDEQGVARRTSGAQAALQRCTNILLPLPQRGWSRRRARSLPLRIVADQANLELPAPGDRDAPLFAFLLLGTGRATSRLFARISRLRDPLPARSALRSPASPFHATKLLRRICQSVAKFGLRAFGETSALGSIGPAT